MNCGAYPTSTGKRKVVDHEENECRNDEDLLRRHQILERLALRNLVPGRLRCLILLRLNDFYLFRGVCHRLSSWLRVVCATCWILNGWDDH